jgi:hypothetical protein
MMKGKRGRERAKDKLEEREKAPAMTVKKRRKWEV